MYVWWKISRTDAHSVGVTWKRQGDFDTDTADHRPADQPIITGKSTEKSILPVGSSIPSLLPFLRRTAALLKMSSPVKRRQHREVRFVPGEKEEVFANPPNTPRRVTMKGSGLNAMHLMAVGVSILASILWMAADFTKSPQERKSAAVKQKEELKRSIADFRRKQDLKAELEYQKKARKESCDLYLSKSSIPNSGYTLYAGRDYAAGEIVLGEDFDDSIPIGNGTMHLASFTFLVHSHPVLNNVKGTTFGRTSTKMELIASKEIKAGAELFVPYSIHPLSLKSKIAEVTELFPYIPTTLDYRLVDEILRDVTETRRRMENSDRRQGSTISTGYLFDLLQRTVARLEPELARLMPASLKEVDRWVDKKTQKMSSASVAALTQPSLASLKYSAKCWTDVGDASDTRATVVTRKVSNGNVITTIPVYMTTGKDASRSSGHCLIKHNVGLCPLSASVHFIGGLPSDGAPNAKAVWSDLKQIDSLSLDAARKLASGTLQLNLLALADLESGTEVCNVVIELSHTCL